MVTTNRTDFKEKYCFTSIHSYFKGKVFIWCVQFCYFFISFSLFLFVFNKRLMSSKWLWGATLQPTGCESTKPIIYKVKIIKIKILLSFLLLSVHNLSGKNKTAIVLLHFFRDKDNFQIFVFILLSIPLPIHPSAHLSLINLNKTCFGRYQDCGRGNYYYSEVNARYVIEVI